MGSYIPSSGSTVYTCKDDINRSFYDPINDEAINLCRWVGQNLSYRCELDCPCAKDIKKKNKYLCPITCSLCVDSPSTSPSEKQSSNPSTYSCEDDVDHSFYDPVKDIAINIYALKLVICVLIVLQQVHQIFHHQPTLNMTVKVTNIAHFMILLIMML